MFVQSSDYSCVVLIIMLRFLDGFKMLIITPGCLDHGVLGALRQLTHHYTCGHTYRELCHLEEWEFSAEPKTPKFAEALTRRSSKY